jgi:cytochrome c-type biogenesis protein CcmF
VIPEIGQFALILALCLALVQGALPLAGTFFGREDWTALARPAAAGQFVFLAIAFGVLAYAFLTDDFSVLYVARNSNTALPFFYKIAAVWGSHEGSMLLWSLVLGGWTLAVAARSTHLPGELAYRAIGVLGLVASGILMFTLFTSNPFDRLMPIPIDGNDLNPLLQDPALVLHPPILYFGYVGFAVAFAFAVAALMKGELDGGWVRWARPWTTWAWMFLTVGIALGSWWAYYELGWGGWWFWDPVENASFMPWLVGAALIHSLAVTEKRGLFKSWTILLAIAAFSLSLLGTFLVRSGVLVSVHAFASDPARGVFILMLLGVITGGALALYAWRAPGLAASGGFKLVSREAFLLLNNVLLVAAAGGVLFGTLYPLFLDALGLGKISVGPPYFNLVFIIPMLPLVLLLGAGMHTAWRSMPASSLVRKLTIPAIAAVAVGAVVPVVWFGGASVMTVLGTIAGFWVIFAALLDPIKSIRSKTPVPRSLWGMTIAHLGVGLFVLGATITSSYNVEVDRRAVPGDQVSVAGLDFIFRGTRDVQGPNYRAIEGEFEVRKVNRLITVLTPQKRVYRVQTSAMTEAAIDAAWYRDLFVALGEPLGADAWSVRIQYKPLIRFIWIGCLVMAFGGLVATTDRRYRVRSSAPESAADAGGAVAARSEA